MFDLSDDDRDDEFWLYKLSSNKINDKIEKYNVMYQHLNNVEFKYNKWKWWVLFTLQNILLDFKNSTYNRWTFNVSILLIKKQGFVM